MSAVTITAAALDAVIAHAVEDVPDECCGLLVGHPDHILLAVRARNLRRSPTRFLVDPEDHFAALHMARLRGLGVIGVYHSHPGSPPVPSDTDRREATYDDYVYVIVSPGATGAGADVRAYRLVNGEDIELELKTSDSGAEA